MRNIPDKYRQVELKEVTAIAFSILQCTETRITRTMYLSCPTCGRTKFNLQESVKKVKEATGHLKRTENSSYGLYSKWSGRNGRS